MKRIFYSHCNHSAHAAPLCGTSLEICRHIHRPPLDGPNTQKEALVGPNR